MKSNTMFSLLVLKCALISSDVSRLGLSDACAVLLPHLKAMWT